MQEQSLILLVTHNGELLFAFGALLEVSDWRLG
jgi:hypothetical protein